MINTDNYKHSEILKKLFQNRILFNHNNHRHQRSV